MSALQYMHQYMHQEVHSALPVYPWNHNGSLAVMLANSLLSQSMTYDLLHYWQSEMNGASTCRALCRHRSTVDNSSGLFNYPPGGRWRGVRAISARLVLKPAAVTLGPVCRFVWAFFRYSTRGYYRPGPFCFNFIQPKALVE